MAPCRINKCLSKKNHIKGLGGKSIWQTIKAAYILQKFCVSQPRSWRDIPSNVTYENDILYLKGRKMGGGKVE